MAGTTTGDLKLYNLQTGEEAETYNCHHSPMVHAEPSRVQLHYSFHRLADSLRYSLPASITGWTSATDLVDLGSAPLLSLDHGELL